MNNDPSKLIVEFSRMTPEMYKKLESVLPRPMLDPSKADSPHYAGYLLGIQYVLKCLRDGYVTS
jgi:uncharacterized protein YjaZ